MSPAEHSVTLLDETVSYRLIRRERQKHIYLRISEEGRLTVSAPKRTDLKSIENILQSRGAWILEHLRKLRQKLESFDPAVSILYCGSQIRIIGTGTDTGKPVFDSLNGTLRVPDERMLGTWLRKQADRILRFRTGRIAERAGIPFSRLYVRNQRARWGSSSSNGNISINWRAVMAPPEVQRYLIVHELVHQLHPNHSRQFWMKVGELCPDYKTCSRWLKQHSVLTGLFRNDLIRGDD